MQLSLLRVHQNPNLLQFFYVGPKTLLDWNNLPLDSKECLTNYRLIGQLDIPGSQ